MNTYDWYHGTKGDAILKIVDQRRLIPSNGQIFLSSAGFAGCFPMGADIARQACFVIKVRCQIPETATVENRSTNVPGTKLVLTSSPIAVDVLEMYIRPKAGPVVTLRGRDAIIKYLKSGPDRLIK